MIVPAPRATPRHDLPPGRRAARVVPGVLGVLVALVGLTHGLPAGATSHDPDCPRWRAAFASMPTRTVVIGPQGFRLSVKLAATDETRRAGFQCATVEEIERTVILFDFGREVFGGFHMWNVPAALDIAFAKASGRIFAIMRMEPGARETHGPMGRYRYALEARDGLFRTHGVTVEHALALVEAP